MMNASENFSDSTSVAEEEGSGVTDRYVFFNLHTFANIVGKIVLFLLIITYGSQFYITYGSQ